jgi:hypothetical protein
MFCANLVDQFDIDAAVPNRLDRVSDLHQLAGGEVRIGEGAWLDEFQKDFPCRFEVGAGLVESLCRAARAFARTPAALLNTAVSHAGFGHSDGVGCTSALERLAAMPLPSGAGLKGLARKQLRSACNFDFLWCGHLLNLKPVPEISTWAMMLLGFDGHGACLLRT